MNLRAWRQYPGLTDTVVMIVYLIGIAWTTHFFTQEVLEPALANQGMLSAFFSIGVEILGSTLRAQLGLFGFLIGLAFIWLFDTYKRYQTLAPLTLIAAIGYNSGMLRAVVSEELTAGVIALFVLSVIAGVQVGGLPLVQYLVGRVKQLRGVPPVSYPQAPTILFFCVSALVVLGLFDLHFSATSGTLAPRVSSELPVNIAAGLILIFSFFKFTKYDNKVRIIQIGPARSGKTSVIGGLAGDIDRVARESDGGRAIDQIRSDLEDQQQFPDRTQNTEDDISYYEFEYMSSRPIFRKKNVIATLDYPGEWITGNRSEIPLSDAIIDYQERRDGNWLRKVTARIVHFIPMVKAETPWSEGAADVKSNGKPDVMALAKLVEGADIVVFTVPLDDFLGSAIERGNVPDYADDVKLVEISGVEGEFVVKTPANDRNQEEKRVLREDGELRVAESGAPYSDPWGETKYLPRTPNGDFYHTAIDRTTRDEYKEEYKDLIRVLNKDLKKSFVWTTTMSDLINEDFMEVYERTTDLLDAPGELPPDLTEHAERVVQADLFETNARGFLRHNRRGRKVHAKWIQKEYIENAWPEFDQMLSNTFEEFVYPVWFEIDPERASLDPPGILLENDTVLWGSDLLLNRFENQKLEDGGRLLEDEESLIESGYRIMYAAAQQELERTESRNDRDAN